MLNRYFVRPEQLVQRILQLLVQTLTSGTKNSLQNDCDKTNTSRHRVIYEYHYVYVYVYVSISSRTILYACVKYRKICPYELQFYLARYWFQLYVVSQLLRITIYEKLYKNYTSVAIRISRSIMFKFYNDTLQRFRNNFYYSVSFLQLFFLLVYSRGSSHKRPYHFIY